MVRKNGGNHQNKLHQHIVHSQNETIALYIVSFRLVVCGVWFVSTKYGVYVNCTASSMWPVEPFIVYTMYRDEHRTPYHMLGHADIPRKTKTSPRARTRALLIVSSTVHWINAEINILSLFVIILLLNCIVFCLFQCLFVCCFRECILFYFYYFCFCMVYLGRI